MLVSGRGQQEGISGDTLSGWGCDVHNCVRLWDYAGPALVGLDGQDGGRDWSTLRAWLYAAPQPLLGAALGAHGGTALQQRVVWVELGAAGAGCCGAGAGLLTCRLSPGWEML